MEKHTTIFLDTYRNAPQIVWDMLKLCVGSLEHPIYHPEGTLEKHIDIVISRAMETDSKELHFAAVLHDICKHGHLACLGKENRIGRQREVFKLGEKKKKSDAYQNFLKRGGIASSNTEYWQNVMHAEHASDFIKLPEVTEWMQEHGVDVEKSRAIVKNHMRMKNWLTGERGGDNGMKLSKRNKMQSDLADIWDELYYFSTYCDSMLKPSRK